MSDRTVARLARGLVALALLVSRSRDAARIEVDTMDAERASRLELLLEKGGHR